MDEKEKPGTTRQTLGETGNSQVPKPPYVRPKSWSEIERGCLVIAFENEDDGWWEAIILSKTGDSYTLQFRDYPHQGTFIRNSSQLALLKP